MDGRQSQSTGFTKRARYPLHFPMKLFIITEMRPYISKEKCERCGECVDTCPYEVFRDVDGEVIVEVPEDCIECTACVDSCPHEAISMGD